MAQFSISDEDFNAPLEEEDQFQAPSSSAYSNLKAASQGNPDTYAKDLEMSKRTGVPVNAVKDNRDEIAKQDATALIKQEDWDKPLTELDNPAVAKYLEDPDSAQVSFDDISILTGLENESNRSWINVSDRVFEGLGDSMMIGMGKTQDQTAIMMLNEMKREGFAGWGWKDVATTSLPGVMKAGRDAIYMAMEGEEATEAWNAEIDRKIEDHKQNLEFAEGMISDLTPDDLTVAEEGIRGGVQMVADMAPGLAISIATRGKFNPTIGLLTAKTYGDSYGSAIVAGKDHDTATQYATIDAALEFATERLPTKRLEKIIGEAGSGGGIKSSLKKWLIGEAMGEQIATATQSLNAYAFELDEELAGAQNYSEVLEIQGRRQAVTFISTLVGGGSMSASIKGVDYLANRERRAMGKIIQKTNKMRGSEFEQERLDNMIYLAQASKTNERASDMFEQFMDKAAPDQQVFMSAEAVDLLNDPPGYILEQMDGSGGDVAIPLATFLKDFANDEAKLELVRPFIKTSEGLSSKNELENDNDGEYIKTLLAKAAEATETKTAADEIYERITAQLVATGRQSTATSRQSAAIVTAQVTTQYEYLKSVGYKKEDGSEVSLEELFADFGLEIVGPEADVAAADFMTQADVVTEDTVTLEDGRTYEKQKTDPDHQLVMVDAELFEDLWVDKIGPGPEYSNQISNRMEQYQQFLERNDTGKAIVGGKEINVPQENVQVGNAYVKGPETGYGGYISLGDGRHRARAMIEQGMKKIPISMTAESIAELDKIIAARTPSEQDRLAQAAAQGFDTSEVLYHGTGAGRSFESFTTGRSMMVFFTSNKEYAEEYGEAEGYYIRPGKQFDMYGNPEHAQMAIDMFNAKGGWRDAVELNGADLGEGRTDYNFDPAQDLQWEMLDDPETDILSDLANMGYTSFRFQEREGIPAVSVLNPADIRSVDAEFDPAETESPRVLAQQNFGTIDLQETRIDEAGNTLEITENAGVLWKEQQQRQRNIQKLRNCLRA